MIRKAFLVILIISSVNIAQKDFSSYGNARFATGLQVGLFNGTGLNINFKTSNFAEGFPFSVKLSLGLSYLDAGNALDARKIFINNNTNGIPEKSGKTYNVSIDFLYYSPILGLKRNYIYTGPRYVMFTGNFNYIGGNEDFDVTSNQWGIGAGVENYFKIVPSIDLVMNLGADYYFSETLYGHDTSYSPDGQNINPREDFTYSDADKAINQPKFQIKAMLGFSYNLN